MHARQYVITYIYKVYNILYLHYICVIYTYYMLYMLPTHASSCLYCCNELSTAHDAVGKYACVRCVCTAATLECMYDLQAKKEAGVCNSADPGIQSHSCQYYRTHRETVHYVVAQRCAFFFVSVFCMIHIGRTMHWAPRITAPSIIFLWLLLNCACRNPPLSGSTNVRCPQGQRLVGHHM